jgi:hypothetical protein
MHRTDASGHSSNLYTEGNPSLGIQATEVDDAAMNAIQEELCRTVEKAGITLVKGTWTQLGSALDMVMQGVAPGGRLTLTTAVPVTTADVSGATTVYYTPHRHNRIAVYDGTQWVWRSFTEMSQATTDNTKSPAAVANNSNYDVFVWLDGSTMRATRGPAWSSDTARGTGAGTTELEFFEGRWVNKLAITNGPAARRGLYVGSIRSDGSAQINDTLAKRHVNNIYQKVPRPMRVVEATNSWTYTTATLRQANASGANQLDCIIGLSEDPVEAEVMAISSNGTNADVQRFVGIGLDSTTVDSSQLRVDPSFLYPNNVACVHRASYRGYLGIGRHFLAWLEHSVATGTTTWYGDNNGVAVQAGIAGVVMG